MKISNILIAAAAVAGLVATTQGAAAGTLSPRLARLSAQYAKSPDMVMQNAVSQQPHQPSSLLTPHVNSSGEVQVYIHYRPGQKPAAAALGMLGASHTLAALGVVQAWIPISHLNQLANLPGVTRVGMPAYAIVRGLGDAQPRTDTCSTVDTGLKIDSAGIAAENVQALQSQGIKGSGVKVGIISDGADCVSSSQTAGYLPSNVWVDSSWPGSGDEGTAMLEEVHAMAPDAELGFCGPNTTVEFVTCYNDFATWGANIISDDLGFPLAFFYNSADITGDFLNSIHTFAQNNPDISLVTSAGNDRQDYYQGDYAASSSTPSIGLTPTGYTPEQGGVTGRTYQSAMDFNGNPYEGVSFQLPQGASSLFMLTWNDPLNGPYDDLDLFLVDSSGSIVDASTYDETVDSTVSPSSSSWNPPAELVQYTNNSGGTQNLKLFVMCYVCNQTSNLLVKLTGTMDGGGTFSVTANGGVYGHAGLADEISAAAAYITNPSGTAAQIEPFSQTGPFSGGDWQNGTTSIPKPDITGIDGIIVSGAGGFGYPNTNGGAYFYGTSAASPNVASVIALLRSAFPGVGYTADQWRNAITSSANLNRLAGSPASSAAGAGLVDAAAAASATDAPITASITSPGSSPYQVNPNTDVNFAATCGYSGPNALSYDWNFGGNSGIPDSQQLTPSPVQYSAGGIYTVTFTCSDPLQTKTDKLTVQVQAAATAADVSLTTKKNTLVTGAYSGTGLGGEQISYKATSSPAHGTLSPLNAGAFSYTPNNGYTGTDSFQYQINNGVEPSNTATVTITVQGSSSGGGSGGGGGALGFGSLASLLGLAGLLALRRRR